MNNIDTTLTWSDMFCILSAIHSMEAWDSTHNANYDFISMLKDALAIQDAPLEIPTFEELWEEKSDQFTLDELLFEDDQENPLEDMSEFMPTLNNLYSIALAYFAYNNLDAETLEQRGSMQIYLNPYIEEAYAIVREGLRMLFADVSLELPVENTLLSAARIMHRMAKVFEDRYCLGVLINVTDADALELPHFSLKSLDWLLSYSDEYALAPDRMFL